MGHLERKVKSERNLWQEVWEMKEWRDAGDWARGKDGKGAEGEKKKESE